ncbi:hypothetical protein R3D73_005464 [Serratia marcescens]|nr:hypothetical protein [Serratia marcescens]ELQ9442541.1 hypothetical protein [Serratia marcescens]ELT5563296.1 hypothetical protein [Serratia marcescens]
MNTHTVILDEVTTIKNQRVSGQPVEVALCIKIQLPEEIFNLYFHEVDLTFSGSPAPINLSKPLTVFYCSNLQTGGMLRSSGKHCQIRRYE